MNEFLINNWIDYFRKLIFHWHLKSMQKYRIMEEKSVKQILTVLCRLLKMYFYMQIMKFQQKNSIG